jgi:hypothetical protein
MARPVRRRSPLAIRGAENALLGSAEAAAGVECGEPGERGGQLVRRVPGALDA